MKSIGDILKSSDFKREVSLLLFFFAALNGLISAIIFMGRPSDPEVLIFGIVGFIQAFIYFVFGLMIRRGSNRALLVCGVLFGLDTLLLFFFPLEQGTAKQLIARAFLAFFLIRYVRKQRLMSAES
jgi:Na+/proline symporter